MFWIRCIVMDMVWSLICSEPQENRWPGALPQARSRAKQREFWLLFCSTGLPCTLPHTHSWPLAHAISVRSAFLSPSSSPDGGRISGVSLVPYPEFSLNPR